jgi:hypothetical protein
VESSYPRSPSAIKTRESTTVADLDDQAFGAIVLRRLKRALLLRFYTESLLAEADRGLLDRVIYASFCDCRLAGLGETAQRLLDEARAGSGLFRRPTGAAEGGSGPAL